MNTLKTLISLAFLVSTVRAAIYITSPLRSDVWRAGHSYDIVWVDDGASPLLNSIGESDVALYHHDEVFVQSLGSVDVSAIHSLSVTPSAGHSGDYYLVFTSKSIDYNAWSATFSFAGAGASGSGNSTTAHSGSSIGSATAKGAGTIVTSSASISGTVTATPISSGVSTGTTTHNSTSTTSSASATHSGAALRAGTSTSLAGSLFLALAGALIF